MTLKELDALTACYISHRNAGPCLIGGDPLALTDAEIADNKATAESWNAECELARLTLAKAYKAKGYTNSALGD